MASSRRGRQRSEFEKIDLIESVLAGAVTAAHVRVGIGDDAAVLTSRGPLVWTVDAQVSGVHFREDWLAYEDIGYRATMAAISDIAAMAARPLGALASLVLPQDFSDAKLERLARGQAEAARRAACPLVGGNITRGSEFAITTSVLGTSARPLLRSGARPGDELWLCGDVGAAALGLAALQRAARKTRAVAACIAAWRRPRALLAEGLALGEVARAGIDISDGLAGDAAHIAKASAVQLVVHERALRSALPAHLVAAASQLGVEPLSFALTGGEDYALLAAGPRARRPRRVQVIGSVERGKGVYLEREGERVPLAGAFDHFSPRALGEGKNVTKRGSGRANPRAR